ncbi:Carbonic anhydrase [Mycena venus]|uniref:Carbonic anhydrase n=1 Tax=Mycena venus TaxID=2733690 RepID=A0A8H6U3F8_9AGAR|nr:Carbonic anhydrase [Mycena venus]
MSTETHPNAKDLLPLNEKWAEIVKSEDPTFFERLAAEKQRPKVLWIGCSDSRVPETTICNCNLGDIFTHRNIANMVSRTQDCGLAVIQYAVDSLLVEDIVVVGHTKCGGVEAAWLASREPTIPTATPLQRWLVPLIDLSKQLGLDRLPLEDKEKALRILTEENARRQVYHIYNLPTVQDAWNRGQKVFLHAWVFQMETGTLVDVSGPFPIEK